MSYGIPAEASDIPRGFAASGATTTEAMPQLDKCEAGNRARWPGSPPLTRYLAYQEAAMSARCPASVDPRNSLGVLPHGQDAEVVGAGLRAGPEGEWHDPRRGLPGRVHPQARGRDRLALGLREDADLGDANYGRRGGAVGEGHQVRRKAVIAERRVAYLLAGQADRGDTGEAEQRARTPGQVGELQLVIVRTGRTVALRVQPHVEP